MAAAGSRMLCLLSLLQASRDRPGGLGRRALAGRFAAAVAASGGAP